jgi:hypothetical protein
MPPTSAGRGAGVELVFGASSKSSMVVAASCYWIVDG